MIFSPICNKHAGIQSKYQFLSISQSTRGFAEISEAQQAQAAEIKDMGKSFHNRGGHHTSDEEPRFLEQVQLFIEHAARKTNVPDDILKYILACDHALRFQIPIRRDNGIIETLTCYRA